MVAEFLSWPLSYQFLFVLIMAFLIVGALVVMSFIVDVLLAAARAASLVALTVRVLGQSRLFTAFDLLSLWRHYLLRFYSERGSIWSIKLMANSGSAAVWRGVFRWEFLRRVDREC